LEKKGEQSQERGGTGEGGRGNKGKFGKKGQALWVTGGVATFKGKKQENDFRVSGLLGGGGACREKQGRKRLKKLSGGGLERNTGKKPRDLA